MFRAERLELCLLTAALALATPLAHAHHGKDFILVETVEVPHPGDLYAFSDADTLSGGEGRESELSMGLMGGLTRALALEIHAHAAKENGEPWMYEATAPAFRILVTRPRPTSSWALGATAEYELARDEAEGDEGTLGLILSRQGGASTFALNLTAGRAFGGREEGTRYGYAIGFRPDTTRRIGWGLEAAGRFDQDPVHETLASLYAVTGDSFDVKIGIGRGFGEEAPRLTLRTGFVWRLGTE